MLYGIYKKVRGDYILDCSSFFRSQKEANDQANELYTKECLESGIIAIVPLNPIIPLLQTATVNHS